MAYRNLQEHSTSPCPQTISRSILRFIPWHTACTLVLLCTAFLLGGCSTTNNLQSIAVTPAAGTQVLSAAGQTAQYKAIGTFIQGQRPPTTQDITSSVTWTSLNTAVATVSPTGLVAAAGTGKATINATLSDSKNVITGTSDVTVTLPTPPPPQVLTSIAIIPAAGAQILTAAGQSAQFRAIGTFTQTGLPTTTQDITSSANWSSQNTSIAIVNNTGLVSAVANGTATISATYNSASNIITGTSNVTVNIPQPTVLTSIAVTPTAGTQILTAAGQTAQFKAIGTYSNSTTQDITNNVTWSSQNTAVATVSSIGVVTALTTGSATISAIYTSAGTVITGTSDVTVNIPPPPVLTSITILPNTQQTTSIGETAQFLAIGNYTGTPATLDLTGVVQWASSDVNVATVSASGLAVTNGGGTTSITAELTSGAGAAIAATPATLTATISGSPITFPTVTLYKVGNTADQGTVIGSYTPSTGGTLTPINCPATAPSATVACPGVFPVGVVITLTIPTTVPAEPAFGGWSGNCAPVYATPPTPSSPGVLAVPYSCTFTTTAGNTAIGAIFD